MRCTCDRAIYRVARDVVIYDKKHSAFVAADLGREDGVSL